MNSITLKRALEALGQMDDILILAHANPDGDAVGSMFALYLALRGMGKRVRCEIKDVPENLRFIVREDAFADFSPRYIVTVDTGDKKLLNTSFTEKYGDHVALNIDHHGTNGFFADETLVDPTAAAACEVLFDLFCCGGIEITKEIAQCLYVGISTDTGCFRYANTTAKTMRTAACLLETGIDNGVINTDIFETKTPQFVAFERAAMNALRLCLGGKCAVLRIPQQMYRDAGIKEADTQGVNGFPRMIAGVYAGVTVKERENGVYHASVRTKEPVNAAAICEKFGGGGHKYAAGCELGKDGEAAEAQLVAAVEEALNAAGLLNG